MSKNEYNVHINIKKEKQLSFRLPCEKRIEKNVQNMLSEVH
jgi:hypothetical protein